MSRSKFFNTFRFRALHIKDEIPIPSEKLNAATVIGWVMIYSAHAIVEIKNTTFHSPYKRFEYKKLSLQRTIYV